MKNKLIIYILISVSIAINSNAQQNHYSKTGIASFYADKFEGRQTANGEMYYHAKKTAAHRTLPFGSVVKVTNLENNKYVVVRINDRGPFIDNRIIDLSKSAAQELDFIHKGLAKVKVELIANTNNLPDQRKLSETNSGGTYYLLNSKKVSPKGKGIQIGSYTENENMIKLVAQLGEEINESVFVEVGLINKQKVYRIIVGNKTNTKDLENLKKKLLKDFPDCFIVDFK